MRYLKEEFYALVRSDADVWAFIEETALDGLCYQSLEQLDAFWGNPKFWATLGYPAATQLPWASLLVPEDLSAFHDYWEQSRHEHRVAPQSKRWQYRHHDGYTVWMEVYTLVLLDQNQRPYRLLSAHRNTTEREMQARFLHSQYETLQSILNQKAVYIIKTDIEGRYTYANDYFCERLNIRPADILGVYSLEQIIPQDHQACIDTVEKCIQNPHTPQSVILRKPHPAAGVFINQWQFIALTDTNGTPNEILCIGYDISERARNKQILNQLLNTAYDLVIVADKQQQILPELSQYTSFLGDQTLTHWQELIDNKDRTAFDDLWRQCLAQPEQEQGHNQTLLIRKLDDAICWINWHFTFDPFSERMYAIGRDVSVEVQQTQTRHRITDSLLRLSQKSSLHYQNLETFVDGLVREVVQTLDADRATFWEYDEADLHLHFRCRYGQRGGLPTPERTKIVEAQWRTYFRALHYHKVIAVSNTDLQEMVKMNPEGDCKAVLDVQIWRSNRPLALLCIRQKEPRQWQFEEENYLRTISEILGTVYASEARKQSEAQYRLLAENSTDGVVSFDAQYKPTYVSPSFARLLGASPGQFLSLALNRGIEVHVHPDDQQAVIDRLAKALQDKAHFLRHSYRVRHADGHYVWLEDNIHYLYDEAGQLLGGVSNSRDISERKRAEARLRESEERYRSVVSALNEGIIVYDEQAKIITCNAAAARILDMPAEQMIGRTSHDPYWQTFDEDGHLIAPEEQPNIRVLRTGQPVRDFLLSVNTGAGKRSLLSVNAEPIRDGQGKTYSVVISFADITQDYQRRKSLQQLNEMLSSIANNVPGMIFQYLLRRDGSDAVLYVSKGVEDLYEVGVSEALADVQLLWVKLYPADISRLQVSIKESAERLIPWSCDFRIQMSDGRIKWVQGRGLPKRLPNGDTLWYSLGLDITAQKNAEAALSDKEQLLNSIYQNINEGIYRSTTKGLLYVNEAFVQMFGYQSQEEILQIDLRQLYARIPDRELLQDLLRQQNTYTNQEILFSRKDGSTFWASVSAIQYKAPEGEIYFDGAIRDVTEQRAAEQALKESQALLASINQNITEGIYRSNRQKLVYANEAFVLLFGFETVEEILEVDIRTLYVSPNQRDQLFEELLENGYYNNREVELRRKDGSTFWVSDSTTLGFDEQGQVYFDGALRDITQQKATKAERQRLAQVAERTADVLMTCNEQGVVTWCNAAIQQSLGFTPQELIGRPIHAKTTCSQTDPTRLAQLQEALRQKQAFNGLLSLCHKDHSQRWINYQTTPIYDEKNNFLYTIVVKRDLTELVEKQRELEDLLQTTTAQNQRLRDFSYITSHNIRSSVANLLGLSELLKVEPANMTYIEMIARSTQKLDKTIHNINALLQVEHQTQAMVIETCQLRECVERVLAQSDQLAKEQGAHWQLDLPEDLHVLAVPVYLDSIIQNLIVNAIKYGVTFASKVIQIRAYDHPQEEETVAFEVQDFGYGIDLEKDGERIFQLGTRLHDISSGQGLGLYMTKRQVEAIGGRIEIESQRHQGSTFRVLLKKATDAGH
ncbi:MAG: PAS domain S-box protein [Bernardetiaceae bacterium]